MRPFQQALSLKLAEGYEEGSPHPPDDKPSVLRKVEKWGSYESMGAPVEGTKFIPMKTPFSAEIMDQIQRETDKEIIYVHTVDTMLKEQQLLGREIGMILDVSDHKCLYSQDIPIDVEYQQVRLVAKQLPSREVVRKVHQVAKDFWSRCPSKFIAIHCAYGFNRTGFLVAAYLVEVLDISVEEAVQRFEIARSPGIRHEKFVEELVKRYNGTATTSSTSTAQLDVMLCPSFLQPEKTCREVDNESLGFMSKEVISAIAQKQVNGVQQQQYQQQQQVQYGIEVDNESLGFEQREVLSAIVQQQVAQIRQQKQSQQQPQSQPEEEIDYEQEQEAIWQFGSRSSRDRVDARQIVNDNFYGSQSWKGQRLSQEPTRLRLQDMYWGYEEDQQQQSQQPQQQSQQPQQTLSVIDSTSQSSKCTSSELDVLNYSLQKQDQSQKQQQLEQQQQQQLQRQTITQNFRTFQHKGLFGQIGRLFFKQPV